MSEMIHPSWRTDRRGGVALLMVLLIVVAITILATGFLAVADTELACGDNTLMRIRTDQLAQSGLEHARGLLLHPQEVPVDQNGCVTYWSGATGQQLVAPSSDYYEVTVVRNTNQLDDYCTYDIACDAYRGAGPDKKGESRLAAQLRLDPCIALGIGAAATTAFWNGLTVQGDVSCTGRLVNRGTIHGDVFSASLDGSIVGQHSTAQPLAWPTVAVTDFTLRYGTVTLPGEVKNTTLGPYNPLRVCHRNSDLILGGNATVDGMLLVEGNLTIRGVNNIVRAGKNLPAVYATGNLIVEKGARLTITGLAAVAGDIRVGGNTTVRVLGALFAAQGLVQTAYDESENANTVTLYNTPAWQSAGHSGGALQFDGVDDYGQTVNCPMRLQVADAYTLSVWIKPSAPQKGGAGILAKTDPAGTDNHWALQFNSDGNRLIIRHPGDEWDTGITLGQVAGAWHHVVIVRSNAGITSYLDPVGIAPSLWKTESWTIPPGNGNGHLNLGADRTVSSSSVYGGLLDDVCIYSRALEVGEVSSPVSVTNLLGYWTFDENAPSVTIIAEPMAAALVTWPGGTATPWSPAAGGFFKSIRRWEP